MFVDVRTVLLCRANKKKHRLHLIHFIGETLTLGIIVHVLHLVCTGMLQFVECSTYYIDKWQAITMTAHVKCKWKCNVLIF